MPWIIKLTQVVVRGKDEEGKTSELLYIGDKSMFSPTTAVLEATRELEHMGNMAMTNLVRSMNALITLDEKEIQTVYRAEKNIDYLNNAITNYLVNINQMTLPIDDARSIGDCSMWRMILNGSATMRRILRRRRLWSETTR